MLNILQLNVDITNLSNFKTKAKAKYFFEINKEEDLDKLIMIFKYIKDNNLKYIFVGSGTNLLFSFDIFKGVVIKNNLLGWTYNNNTKVLESYSSEKISDIADSIEKKYNQNLLHRFIGLPGSIGGAIFGNAGCFGLEIENNFLDAKVFNIDNGNIETFSKEKMKFLYRSSILKQKRNQFIISSRFDLSKKIEKYSSNVDNIYFREYKQPKGNTCGSFFKNPSKDNSAGSLIEKAGLKGYKIGGAYFSNLHANFLMSDGTASYDDLINLISLAKVKVKEISNIELIPEVIIIKNK